jgi:hypothetical protein
MLHIESPYLEVLRVFRDDFTVISGLSHSDGASHDRRGDPNHAPH